MTALADLAQTISFGVMCTQEAGDGPFVYVATNPPRRFSSRTARVGERLGLMVLSWDPMKGRWRWMLTEKGVKFAKEQAW